MKKYDSYKESGIEWLGLVPSVWGVKRLKDVLKTPLKYGANEPAIDEDLSNPRYIRITDFGDDEKLRIDTFKSLSYDIAKNYLLKNGDILFARSGATVGKSFQFKNYDGLACYAGYLIKASPKTSILVSDFLSYFTKSFSYDEWKENIFIQATIQNISAEKYDRLEFAVPSISEQISIAQYLDTKTQAIDKKVNLLEKKIGYYKELRKSIINETVTKGLDKTVKLKDSGIKWIGQIPEHWDVKRLKDISKSLSSGATPTSGNMVYYEDGTVSWLNTGDLNDGLIRGTSKKLNKIVFSDYPNLKIQKAGTLVIAMYGATIGKMGILNIESTTNQACCCIDLKNNFNTKFLFYQLLSIKEIIISLSVGGTQPNVSQSILGFVKLLIPTLSEQTEIATYLDHKTQTIDKIVGNIQNQISTLKELRKTLINDVVTGKIKVINSN